MNIFLSCSPRRSQQNKKKIIEIGLVDREIISKYDIFVPYPDFKKKMKSGYGTKISYFEIISRSTSPISIIFFFILLRASRATRHKKVHWNPITGSRDNVLINFFKFSPTLYSNFFYFLGESRIESGKNCQILHKEIKEKNHMIG